MGFLDARVNPANLDTLTAAKIGAPGSATATALNATIAGVSVPRWKPNTQYAAGEQVIAPNNNIVSAVQAFWSTATYNEANWVLSDAYAPKSILSPAALSRGARSPMTMLTGTVTFAGGGAGADATGPVIGTTNYKIDTGGAQSFGQNVDFTALPAQNMVGKGLMLMLKPTSQPYRFWSFRRSAVVSHPAWSRRSTMGCAVARHPYSASFGARSSAEVHESSNENMTLPEVAASV